MLTRHSPLKIKNSKDLSQSRCRLVAFLIDISYGCLIGYIIVARVRPRTSKGITDLLLPPTSITSFTGNRLAKKTHNYYNNIFKLAYEDLVRYWSQPNKSTHELRAAMHHYSQNKKRNSICLSFSCPDLVSFPGLSQIKPQAPRLVVPLRQFLQVSTLRPYSPRNPKTLISP